MISTKMSAEEAKEYSGTPEPGNMPAYSWGTTVCLDDDLLSRLGMTAPPDVGTEFMLTARVVVTSTRASQQQDGDKEASCELQITEMELGPAGSKTSAADTLYGSST